MPAPASGNAPSPFTIFAALTAYQLAEAVKAGIELDVFSAIGEGNSTSDAVAKRCHASPRGTRILCDYLVVHGFLKKENSSYALTLDSATFLDRRSPAYLGSISVFLNAPMLAEHFTSLADAVRKGGTASKTAGTVAPENPVWVEFARGMSPMMAMPAEAIGGFLKIKDAGACKILDIAASHGIFGITLARQNPQAQVVAVDWQNVLALGKENAEKAGVGARYTLLPGSAFDVNFGSDYDVILLTNFLHHFDAPTCETLLRKCHAALKPGGRVATLEFVPNDDRVTPVESAGFSLVMLASTPSGDAYTFAELDRMARNAGFARNEIHALLPGPQHLIISHKG